MDEGILHMFGLGGKFAWNRSHWGWKIRGWNLWTYIGIAGEFRKMKVFFGQKNAKYIAWSKEREVIMLTSLVPKTWDQPTWKYTHFINKNYFGFPPKKNPETLPTKEGQVSKNQPKHRVLLVFSPFPKTSQNGNRSSVRRGKTSGETPNIPQVRKSIQSLLGEMDGWVLEVGWQRSVNGFLSFFGYWYIYFQRFQGQNVC